MMRWLRSIGAADAKVAEIRQGAHFNDGAAQRGVFDSPTVRVPLKLF
jgi:hypothetical protein